MKVFTFIAALFAAGPALAHTGHLGEVAGHDHWLAAGALALAAGVGLWVALRDRARAAAAEAEEAEKAGAEEEVQEA